MSMVKKRGGSEVVVACTTAATSKAARVERQVARELRAGGTPAQAVRREEVQSTIQGVKRGRPTNSGRRLHEGGRERMREEFEEARSKRGRTAEGEPTAEEEELEWELMEWEGVVENRHIPFGDG